MVKAHNSQASHIGGTGVGGGTLLGLALKLLGAVAELYKLNFIIPENATFATAIGALAAYNELDKAQMTSVE